MEIERKFLVKDDSWRKQAGEPTYIAQSYFPEATAGKVYLWLDESGEKPQLNIRKWNGKSFVVDVPQEELDKLGAEGKREMFDDKGSFTVDDTHTGRVRFKGENRALITLKADTGDAAIRHELEFDICPETARSINETGCTEKGIEKYRYELPSGTEHPWEVDVFDGANKGLVLAELEMPDAEMPFAKPQWLGDEVTYDRRFTNRALAEHPYSQWDMTDKLAIQQSGAGQAR